MSVDGPKSPPSKASGLLAEPSDLRGDFKTFVQPITRRHNVNEKFDILKLRGTLLAVLFYEELRVVLGDWTSFCSDAAHCKTTCKKAAMR